MPDNHKNDFSELFVKFQQFRHTWCQRREDLPSKHQEEIGRTVQELDLQLGALERALNPAGDWWDEDLILEDF